MRMGECEKECMGTQREKCTEFERLSGEQILGYEIRLTPGLPWKLCFINLSLSPGALVYDIYTEVTNTHPYFTFYTHTIVRVCVLICAGFFFLACGHVSRAQGNHHCVPPYSLRQGLSQTDPELADVISWLILLANLF